MRNVTMVGDEEGEQAFYKWLEEQMDNMTQEDWERVFENLRKSKPPQ